MKIPIALVVVLGLCIVLVAAKPGGGRGGGKGKDKKQGRGNPMTPDEEGGAGNGRKGGRRNPGNGRTEHTESTDPACEALECEKPTRDTVICGTDGETYRSECLLVKDRCKGRIAADVEVATQGRCAGADKPPKGGPRGHGKRPGGGKPNRGGKHPKGGRRDYVPTKEECMALMTTMAPPTAEIDYVTGEEEASVCTVSCPSATPEMPLQAVCGTNGRTYESACVLELVACITGNLELMVSTEQACE